MIVPSNGLTSCALLFTVVVGGALADPAAYGEPSRAPAEATRAANAAPAEPTSGETITPASTQPADEKPIAGPKYLDLRYDEDFSYLDGPDGSYRKDFFDPIKWIHLTDDLTLSIGGEFRGRLEAETNTRFGSTEPAQDTFFIHRYFLHTDLRYRRLARVFFQGINAMIEDRDLPLLPIHEDRWDVHQLFGDLRFLGEDVPLAVRFGRQELSYGRERLISPLDWANTRRTFDGAKIFYESDVFDIDFFYVKPVPIDLTEGLNRKPDAYREEQDFYGVYAKYKGIPDHYVEPYFLALIDDGDLVNANGRTGDLSLYTLGGRVGGKTGPFDYDGELAGQWGKFAGDTVQAWMAAADAGYTLKDVPWSPRFGVGFDWGSGDEDPFDDNHQTFNQLFPLGHAHLGYLDLFARQNVLATNVNLTFKPLDRLTTRLAWYAFWNDEVRDALYNAGGAPVRRDRLGNSGHDVGNELDLTIKYAIDVHSSVLFGYSHFWHTNFIRSSAIPDRDADLIYLQYALKF